MITTKQLDERPNRPLAAPVHLMVVVARPPCVLTSKNANIECWEGRMGEKVRGRRWEE